MALTNFFRINLPYGLKEGEDNSWAPFNREYMPLGYNSTKFQKIKFESDPYSFLPIYTVYKGNVLRIAKKHGLNIQSDEGKSTIFLYDDASNPSDGNSKKKWDRYFAVLQDLSKLEVKYPKEPK